MGQKEGTPDLGIRFREVVEPIAPDGLVTGFATLDDTGKYEVIPLTIESCREDIELLSRLMCEGIRWHMPDFRKYVESYDELINKIANARNPTKAPVWRTFMEESLSEIASYIVAYLREYVYLEDPNSYEVLAVFVIQSFFREQMVMCPTILVDGVYGSGKTTLMKALERISYRGHRTGNYSAAQLASFVDEYNCTILLDEANDNLSSERGPSINMFLKEATDKNGIYERIRVRNNGMMAPTTSKIYTNVAVCTLGGFMEDTMSRGISIKMPTYNTSDCEDIDLAMLTRNNEVHDPSVILGKLHALRFVTKRARLLGFFGSFGEGFVDFGDSLTESYYELKDGTYGEKVFSQKRGAVRNRSSKILVCYYAISKYLGNSRQVITYILKSEDKKTINKQASEYGIIISSICELILGIDEDGERLPLFEKSTLTPQKCVETCRTIKMKDITERGMDIIRDSFDLAGLAHIDKYTAAQVLAKLEIPVREGGGRYKYLDPERPGFLDKLVMAIRRYAPKYESSFKNVTEWVEKAERERSEGVKVVTVFSDDLPMGVE